VIYYFIIITSILMLCDDSGETNRRGHDVTHENEYQYLDALSCKFFRAQNICNFVLCHRLI
jgi:hypothetical protein